MEQNTGNKLATRVIIIKTLGGKSEERQYAVGHFVGGTFVVLSPAEIAKLSDTDYRNCISDTKRYVSQAESIEDIDSLFTNEPLSRDTAMCPVVLEKESVVSMRLTKVNPSFIVSKSKDIEVDWGDGTREANVFSHAYSDGLSEHRVVFYGGGGDLSSLSCNSCGITELDVSKSVTLTTLMCLENQLASLDISKNTALTSLNCGSNQLTSLDISQNMALTSLNCSSNRLTSLDVSKNTALTSLNCGSNQLTSLDISQNTALTSLDCYSNRLTELDVSMNTALTYLSCHLNQLTQLDVTQNTALTYLSCDSNKLTELNVTKNIALARFSCGSNRLASLDISKNTELTSLNCSSNQLTSLDVSMNTALTYLSCDSNRLTSLNMTQNMEIDNIHCDENPFITDETALRAFANTLPQREASKRGYLFVNNSTSVAWIQSVCDARNWDIY